MFSQIQENFWASNKSPHYLSGGQNKHKISIRILNYTYYLYYLSAIFFLSVRYLSGIRTLCRDVISLRWHLSISTLHTR